MRVSYLGYSRPVAEGVGFGVVEVVLIAGKAIGTMTVVGFSIVGELVVFEAVCFSFRDGR